MGIISMQMINEAVVLSWISLGEREKGSRPGQKKREPRETLAIRGELRKAREATSEGGNGNVRKRKWPNPSNIVSCGRHFLSFLLINVFA